VKRLILCVLLVAAGCRDERPPAPTVEQSHELNEAEDLLDNMAANEEGPEQSPGPSNQSN
jgi:hypothetical protein